MSSCQIHIHGPNHHFFGRTSLWDRCGGRSRKRCERSQRLGCCPLVGVVTRARSTPRLSSHIDLMRKWPLYVKACLPILWKARFVSSYTPLLSKFRKEAKQEIAPSRHCFGEGGEPWAETRGTWGSAPLWGLKPIMVSSRNRLQFDLERSWKQITVRYWDLALKDHKFCYGIIRADLHILHTIYVIYRHFQMKWKTNKCSAIWWDVFV